MVKSRVSFTSLAMPKSASWRERKKNKNNNSKIKKIGSNVMVNFRAMVGEDGGSQTDLGA